MDDNSTMTTERKHILGQFDKALDQLRSDVLEMAVLASRNLDNAVNGLLNRDRQLCNAAIADDDEVDQLEKRIDQEAEEIIVKYSPMASNLRQVIATMKVAQNLERLSDQASNIAKRGRRLSKCEPVEEAQLIKPLHQMANTLLTASMKSFAEGDNSTAMGIDDQDEALDKAYKQTSKDLISHLEKDSSHAPELVHLMFVLRFLERIGDYAVNISEETVYAETADDIRHTS